MQTLLSGLAEQAYLADLDAESAADSLSWLAFADFIAAAESSAMVERECLWVWLYRAPWAVAGQSDQEDVTAALETWQNEQRAVLKLRRHLGPRLLLVNVDQVPLPLLRERIGLTKLVTYSPPASSEMSPAIAALFEYIAPQYWDLFELLEATAWLPEGEPIFRQSMPTPGTESLFSLLQSAKDGLALALSRSMLAQFEDQNRELENQRIRLQIALNDLTSEVQSLTDSNGSLQTQLHSAQEDLERSWADNQVQAAALERQLGVSRQVDLRLKESSESLEQANLVVTGLRQDQERSNVELCKLMKSELAATEENSRLLTELHHVQNEIEGYFADSETNNLVRIQQAEDLKKLESTLAKTNNTCATLDIDYQVVAAENKQLLEQLLQAQEQLEVHYLEGKSQSTLLTRHEEKMVKVGLAMKTIEHTAAATQAEQEALVQENELLQDQLFQAQNELEAYYQAHCEMQKVMDQSERTMHRARVFVSQLMCDV